jgi:hypothetical protein
MITIKEEFLAGVKAQRAIALGGGDAIVMWLALKGYAASHPTDGFIPDEDVDRLPGAPKNARKMLKCLGECGAVQRDGTRGAGLVDKVEHGWQLHDYLDHATSSLDVEQRRERERLRKATERLQKVISTLAGVPLSDVRDHYGDLKLDALERIRSAVEKDPLSFGRPWILGGTELARVRGQSEDSPLPPSRASTHAHAGAPDAGARPHALPSPAQPPPGADPTSQPLPEQPANAEPAEGLAGRVVDRGSDPDGTPKPRHDPAGERFAFARWFPSQRLLDWARTIGLSEQAFDDAVIAVRNKIRGPGDIGFWDKHVRSFALSEAKHQGSAPTPPESPEATARRAKAQADLEARRAESERLGREAREKAAAEGRPDPLSSARALVLAAAGADPEGVPGAAQ